jgi:hypothetical protein
MASVEDHPHSQFSFLSADGVNSLPLPSIQNEFLK